MGSEVVSLQDLRYSTGSKVLIDNIRILVWGIPQNSVKQVV